MTPHYVIRHDCDEPHCSKEPRDRRIERLLDELAYAPSYAEPGYDNPKRGILFANWNHLSARAGDLLERAGYALEWSDEWTTCDSCGRALRTQPDSYSWQPATTTDEDGATYCTDCTDWPAYLESREDRPTVAAFAGAVDPAEHGYVRLSDAHAYESGFHPGQTDDPRTVLAELHAQGQRRILFVVSSTGQFDIAFETWQRAADSDEEDDGGNGGDAEQES